ncbi:MAG: efflux RND transporter periplasmic adaptor subunit [Verrucomicrobiaceae bacterium]|nr:MAG: efflux RND transporter periplasmic adaptor subunit [Verrucomicrobiaceae bacterium]
MGYDVQVERLEHTGTESALSGCPRGLSRMSFPIPYRASVMKFSRKSHRDPGMIAAAPLWVASFLCLGLAACRKPEAVVLPPPVVEVLEVVTSDVPLKTTLIGQLDSPQNVEVRARVEAFVDQMLFTEGVEVKAGDVLFELDRKPFIEKLAAAEGALGEAEAALNKYQTDVRRLSPLYEKRAIPKQDLDNAVASVAVGEAGVTTARARVDSARLDLGYCTVKAPTTGLIGAKQVSIGELVGKGDPTLLATISTLDPIWFYCNVSEVEYIKAEQKSRENGREIAKLPLNLVLADGREIPEQGHFVFIDRAVDVKTGTLRVRAEFANKQKLLRPGMFARVRVDLGTQKDSIQVPERAVVQLQGKNFIWVINADSTTSQRPVVLGEQVGSNFLVREGLKPGERIVLEGLQKVREGVPVTAMTGAQLAAAKPAHAAGEQPAKH